MEQRHILTLGLILFTASVVAMLCRRLRLPYSIGLVGAGIALALLPVHLNLPLSRELIFDIFLPPLVFEAALQLPWHEFRRNLPLTLLLAFPGVAIAAGLVACGVHWLLGWGWMGAALFGTLIAATDPVSVIAAFKELKAPPRLSLVVEAESLVNDGSAAVGFAILVALASGGPATPLHIGGLLLWTVIGGVLVGAAVAGGLLLIAGRTDDHLVEITLTTIAAYGSFLFADRLGMSGVLASLTAGLMMGCLGWRGAISEEGRGHVTAFWTYVAFLANSIVFILIGGNEAHLPLRDYAAAALIAAALVLVGRAVAVYPLSALVARTPLRLSLSYQHVLFWGGLRGALALALALGVPASVPERSQIVVVAFAVVALSIFVQGLTMPWLIRRLGLDTAES
jgi:CPA1 family monovalent cation:H+ antiporter